MRVLAFHSFAAMVAAAAVSSAFAFGANPRPDLTVWEYVNDLTGHYALIGEGTQEMHDVDALSESYGWHRTNYRFVAYKADNQQYLPAVPADARDVCRFYAPSTVSHFFTADASECQFVRNAMPAWIYVGIAFKAHPSIAGACAPGTQPVYRLYDGRQATHRFNPDPAMRERMLAQGWTDEGIAFCTTSWEGSLPVAKSFFLEPQKEGTVADCERFATLPQGGPFATLAAGGCLGLGRVPTMANRIPMFLPPDYVTNNPLYSETFTQLTGYHYDLLTAQPVDAIAAVASHSFVQRAPYPYAGSNLGIHLSAIDRTDGVLASIEPIYQFQVTPPDATTPMARIFPWGNDSREHWVEIAFDLDVRTFHRLGAQGEGYGAVLVRFVDARSGGAVNVTLQTFGSLPPADAVGRFDASSDAWVSTVFRADTLFGVSTRGDFIPCSDGGCASTAVQPFAFHIARADFEKILALARTVNPGLSESPSDYLLASFRFRGEVYQDAEIGFTLRGPRLNIYGY